MRRRGFSLLEVMVALAILAGALTAISVSIGLSVRSSTHARLISQATFLCRQRLVELEDGFVVNGFTDDAGVKEEGGVFDDPGLKRFRWAYRIERVRLPSTDQLQSAATRLLQNRQQIGAPGAPGSSPGSSSSGSSNSGLNTGMMGSLLGPVKDTLEQGIRKVTVQVLWTEPGQPEQSVQVVAFYTDMRRMPFIQ
jgi:general secretion pathway protein I